MNPKPDIRVPVDRTNPGQFFACCGLLELARRLWAGAQGWFDDRTTFCIAIPPQHSGTLEDIIQQVVACPLMQLDDTDPLKSPLALGHPFNLRLDWWLDSFAGGDTFRTWSGRQKGPEIVAQLRGALNSCVNAKHSLFDTDVFVTKYDSPGEAIVPFYFDSRRQPKALDVGFSVDVQDMPVATFPAVEFLGLVGLQRFRPASVTNRQETRYWYRSWHQALEPAIAAIAAAGLLAGCPIQQFSFNLIQRVDEQAYYSFSQARLERSVR